MDQPTSSSNENRSCSGPTLYRTVWRSACFALGIIGVIVAGLLLPGIVLAVVGIAVLVIGATAAVAYGVDDESPPSGTRARAVCNAMVGAAVVGVTLGLSTILGPAVLLLCVALALTSPPAVHWYRVKFGSPDRPDQASRPTLDLCREWHDSFEALGHATTATARLRPAPHRHCPRTLPRRTRTPRPRRNARLARVSRQRRRRPPPLPHQPLRSVVVTVRRRFTVDDGGHRTRGTTVRPADLA